MDSNCSLAEIGGLCRNSMIIGMHTRPISGASLSADLAECWRINSLLCRLQSQFYGVCAKEHGHEQPARSKSAVQSQVEWINAVAQA